MDFLREVKETCQIVRDFARKRQIPSEEQIDSIRVTSATLSGNQKSAVEAMADNIAFLRKQAVDAGVNPETMPVSFTEMLTWAIDTFTRMISALDWDEPLIKAARGKFVAARLELTQKHQLLAMLGGEPAYEALSLMTLLSNMTNDKL